MKSILEELYNGNINPSETMIPTNPNFRPVTGRISNAMDNWKDKLSPEDFKKLEALLDLFTEADCMEISEAFTGGFKLGALIMMEVLAGNTDYK